MMKNTILLGVNVDHVATLRQQRGTRYPDPVFAAQLAEQAGADGITVHLREDKRHIQPRDVTLLRQILSVPLNLEMAASEDMVVFAEHLKPEQCCLVPERRAELTTEGGLDVIGQEAYIKSVCQRLADVGIEVSLFIAPEIAQIDAAIRCQAPVIEIHTGHYTDAQTVTEQKHELEKVCRAAQYAKKAGLIVNAGHGLNYQNTQDIAAIPELTMLNIGHAIVARAVLTGMQEAVQTMKQLMAESR